MKYRIKNNKSGNFVTPPITSLNASRLFDSLYKNRDGYAIVEFETDINKMSDETKPMDEINIAAIKYLLNNTLKYDDNQKSVVGLLTKRYNENEFVITEKENFILWEIIFKNRENVEDRKLLSIANQYFRY